MSELTVTVEMDDTVRALLEQANAELAALRQRAEAAERERDGALASLGEAQQIVANLREAAVWQEAVSEQHRHQVYKVVEERDLARAMAREVADVIESLQIETDMYRAVRLASCISRLRGEEVNGAD